MHCAACPSTPATQAAWTTATLRTLDVPRHLHELSPACAVVIPGMACQILLHANEHTLQLMVIGHAGMRGRSSSSSPVPGCDGSWAPASERAEVRARAVLAKTIAKQQVGSWRGSYQRFYGCCQSGQRLPAMTHMGACSKRHAACPMCQSSITRKPSLMDMLMYQCQHASRGPCSG